MAFRGGLSFNINDLIIPDVKEQLIENAQGEVSEVWDNYNMGLITNNERYNQIIGHLEPVWIQKLLKH